MYQINLGKSGLKVPTIAIGCMRIGEMIDDGDDDEFDDPDSAI